MSRRPIAIDPLLALLGCALGAGLLFLSSMQLTVGPGGAKVSSPGGLTAEEKEILSHLSIEYLSDGVGGLCKTIRATGVNLQLVNGLDTTQSANCVGNLIVGYHEPGNTFLADRTGSHNVVVGDRHAYTGFGGIVAAQDNALTGPYATVTGGTMNLADGNHAAVNGGTNNQAYGDLSAINGGRTNVTSGGSCTVNGGQQNDAAGAFTTINGGYGNWTLGLWSTVAGGSVNSAEGDYSSTSGGTDNHALHAWSTASGGCSVTTAASCDHLP